MEIENLEVAMRGFGVSVEQAVSAVKDFSTLIPPFTEEDIARVKMNPSLSVVDKIRIVRQMKRQMKGGNKCYLF